MSEDFPGFSLAERDRRWGAARRILEARGMDCLIVFGNDRFPISTYFSNDRIDMIVIFPRRGEPIGLGWSTQLVAEHLESTRRGEAVWMEDVRHGARAQHIVATLKELGCERSRIGVLGLKSAGVLQSEGIVPYTTWQAILEGLPQAQFEDVWEAFRAFVLVKSEEELRVLRKSAAAGEAACAALLETARPGVNEAQLYAAAMEAVLSRGVRMVWMIIQSGPACSSWGPPMWLFRPQPSRVIQRGDIINAEVFPEYGMLETQQQMCIAVGDIHPMNQRCAEIARRAYEIGLEALKPGARFGDIVAAMEAPVLEIGGWNLTPMIHVINPLDFAGSVGIGIEKNLPGIERYKNVRGRPTQDPEIEIRAGMAFAFEPNCHIGTHRINIGGTVVATEKGPVELNTLANHMQHVPA